MANLLLQKDYDERYHVIFRNNHGRLIYLSLIRLREQVAIIECSYLDRTKASTPKLLRTRVCEVTNLLDVIRDELDKSFDEIKFCDDVIMSREYLVSSFLGAQKKKILIMIADGDKLKTIFKSKFRREIYLELALNDGVATMTQCHYVDKRGKGKKKTPQGLVTVRFDFSLKNLLNVVNSELEGGFTDAIVTHEHTLTLDCPICGAI